MSYISNLKLQCGVFDAPEDQPDEKFSRERENAPNYPFAEAMRFCSRHTRDSDVIDVIECADCHVEVKP